MASSLTRYPLHPHGLAVVALGVAAAFTFGSCSDDETTAPLTPLPVGGSSQGGSAATGGEGGSGGLGGSLLYGEPELVVEGEDHPTRIELDADQIYWTRPAHDGPGAVRAVAKEEGDPVDLATVADEDVRALSVDGSNVYYASVTQDGATGTVAVVAASGGDSTPLGSASGTPGDLQVAASMVYWSYVGQGSGIWQVAKIGGTPEPLYTEGSRVTFLWLDAEELFFVDTGTGPQTGTIGNIELGSGLTTIIAEQMARPWHIVGGGGYIYFPTSGDGAIHRMTKGDEIVATIASGQQEPYGIAVDDSAVYWTNRAANATTGDCDNTNGSVMVKRFDGDESVELASGLSCPMGIAVDDDAVYWVSFGLEDDHESGSVMRVPKLSQR